MATVLVIDDSDYVRSFCRDVLSDAGYIVLEAPDGLEGVEQFRSAKPDCVLLDIILPDIDGLEVLKQVRDITDKVPVLIMTGDDPGWARRTCEGYGANGFLSKALDADRIVDSVEEAILEAES